MSFIEKMSVLGIRSFSVDTPQRIEFRSPVTLIVGPNGSGKTSLIECLKYSTTGELPPGAKQSGAFVHDPKLVGEVEVKAKVQLQLRDVRGDRVIITRNLLATQKARASSVSMRTLDGSIRRQRGDNEPTTLNAKCANLDTEIVDMLGVSKAMLENVLFCHQEDANWPLAEGKVVKQRFDDIFASTKYVKVLEAIRECKKEYDGELKTYKKELEYLKVNVDRADSLRGDLSNGEKRLQLQESELEVLNKRLDPLAKQLSDYRQRQRELHELNVQLETIKKERLHKQDAAKELRDSLKGDVFKGDDSELASKIGECENQDASLISELSSAQRAQDETARRLERLVNESRDLHIDQGRLQQEAKRAREAADELASTARRFGRSFEPVLEDAVVVDAALQNALRQLEQENSKEQECLAADEACAQVELQEARERRSKTQHALDMKLDLQSTNKIELQKKQAQLRGAAAVAQRLETTQRERVDAELDFANAERDADLSKLRDEIEELRLEEHRVEEECYKMEGFLEAAQRDSLLRAEVTRLEEEEERQRRCAERLRNKQRDTLEQVFCHEETIPMCGLLPKLETIIEQLSEERQGTQALLNAATRRLTDLEADAAFLRRDLRDKESQRGELDSRIRSVLAEDGSISSSVEAALSLLKEAKRAADDRRSEIQGSVDAYRRFRDKLATHAACPLCHRNFSSRNEADELAEELDRTVRRFPKELLQAEKELENLARREKALIRLQPEQERLEKLDAEMPQLREKDADLSLQISKLRTEVDGQNELLDMKQSDLELARSVTSDAALIDRSESECRALLEQIMSKRRLLIQSAEAKTNVDEVQHQLNALREQRRSAHEKMNTKRMRLLSLSNHLDTLRDKSLRLREEALRLEREVSAVSNLREDLVRLEAEAGSISAEIGKLRLGLNPLDDAVRIAEATLEAAKRCLQATRCKHVTAEAAAKENLAELRRRADAVAHIARSGVATRLDAVDRRLASTAEEQRKLELEQRATEQLLTSVRRQQALREIRQRQLSDNRRLRRYEADVGQLDETLMRLQRQLGDIDVNSIHRQYESLLQQEEDLRQKQQLVRNKITEWRTRVTELDKQLATPELKTADKAYNDRVLDLRTTEIVSEDLNKYYRALDTAIMRYHSSKMEEINKIIRELWSATYRGNDIDYVKVCSDLDSEGANRARRNFNYRLVMVKSGHELDMRGRCSAGQRVLACLVIRLALAETFGLQCGVLALDEPTTNLDRDNIESLANSLSDIIRARRSQKNFQLVIITHDEEFLQHMGNADLVDEYFRLLRNDNGVSLISREKLR